MKISQFQTVNTVRVFANRDFPALLRGDAGSIISWNEDWNPARPAFFAACIVLGSGLYGAAMGWWHSPQQGMYVAVKFPLILLLTAVGNALINSLLALQLGLNISFRQSFAAILMSFAITASILGAFAPILGFMVWNLPAMSNGENTRIGYDAILVMHVSIIAFAGSAGNARLFQLLSRLGGSPGVGCRVLFAWLAANLFLGAQLSWVLRPFVGSPGLPVEFIRPNALHGNFYESLFRSVLHVLHHN
jgi:hypothetical protein